MESFFAVVLPIGLLLGALALLSRGEKDDGYRAQSAMAEAAGMAMVGVCDAFKGIIAFFLLVIMGMLVWFCTIPYGRTVGWW